MYAPASFSANGNVYQTAATFVWNNGSASNFATWKTNSGQDANSRTCAPSYVNATGADFHLSSGDACAKDTGVNVSGITTVDIDGQTRPYGVAWDSGADEWWPSLPPPAPPTLVEVLPLTP